MNQSAQIKSAQKSLPVGGRGFTLIELLVVVAVLGILASVVLVAINPATRLAEARDAGKKNDVGQMATAVESYFTNNNGVYPAGTAILVTEGYLKRDPGTVTIEPALKDNSNHIAWSLLEATTATCGSGTGALKYWVYRTATGASQIECLAAGDPAP